MLFKTPKFWQSRGALSKALMPLSKLYEFIGSQRFKNTRPIKFRVPIICVGNLVMGGAGKTPMVMYLVERLLQQNMVPHIIIRGYGAVVKDSIKVDFSQHNYLHVGDEALLLAKCATTWAGHDRILSTQLAIEAGANVIILDDGLQNNAICKDLALLVVDTEQCIGNGLIFPAGPLRESVEQGLAKCNALVAIGKKALPDCFPEGALRATIEIATTLKPQPVIAFAGLGYPLKFKKSLLDAGFEIVEFISFADHHPYTITEIAKLIKLAKLRGVPLVTTRKDYVRLPAKYLKLINVIEAKLIFEQPQQIDHLLEKIINNN